MAQAVELSPAHFSRMFRKSTGETPHQFFLRQRVERAKEMLRSAQGRVLDVAVACGFKSQQHFAQASVMCVGPARQSIARNFWATNLRTLGSAQIRSRAKSVDIAGYRSKGQAHRVRLTLNLHQEPGGDGLLKWTEADRRVAGTDIVFWY